MWLAPVLRHAGNSAADQKNSQPSQFYIVAEIYERKIMCFIQFLGQRSHLFYLASFEKKEKEKCTRPQSDFYSRTP
jgi:hypothetical protein